MKEITILLIIIMPQLMAAQNIDYNSIILPANVTEVSFEEKLVRLAWQNNPANKVFAHQTNIADLQVKQARWSWLDGFRIQGNVNEFVLNESADIGNRAAFFPKYNISGIVSLGYFVNIPLEVRESKQQLLITELNTDLQKLTIRAEVLTRYQNYLKNLELLKLQTEITEDLYASLSLAEQQFKNGELALTAFNNFQDRYNNQRLNLINAQANFNISKISLEEMIGVKLEDVQ